MAASQLAGRWHVFRRNRCADRRTGGLVSSCNPCQLIYTWYHEEFLLNGLCGYVHGTMKRTLLIHCVVAPQVTTAIIARYALLLGIPVINPRSLLSLTDIVQGCQSVLQESGAGCSALLDFLYDGVCIEL